MTRPTSARRVAVVCLATAGAFAASSALFSQDSGQVFRGETTLVYVDAYPRQNDRIVEGLSAKDFQIFEEGKPQAVQTFEFVRFEEPNPGAERRDPISVADSERQAADPRNRLFVVFLDVYHLSRLALHDIPGPLLGFLDETLSPNDLFAVTTPEIPVSQLTFARNTLTITSDLRKLSERYDFDLQTRIPRTETEMRLTLCGAEGLIPLFRLDAVYTSLENLVVRLGVLRDERKNLLLFSEGWTTPAKGPGRPAGRGGQMMPPPITVVDGRLTRGQPRGPSANSAWCNAEIARLENIDFEARFRELVTSSARANVSISAIDPGGLKTDMVSAALDKPRGNAFDPNGLRPKLSVLRTLAGANDGHAVVNTNDISIGMGRIAERLSAFYLLGYYSTNTTNDGRYRKIDVKVARPGVSVSARPGYLAPPPAAVVAKLKAEAAARSGPVVRDDVSRAIGELARLDATDALFGDVRRVADGLEVVAELPSRELEEGRWSRGAAIEVGATSHGGATTTGRASIPSGERAVVIHVPVASELAGGWRVRVRATGGDSPLEARLELPALDAPATIGSPLVLRVPAAARLAPQPVAERRFRRGERLRVEWPVVAATDVQSARLLGRNGQAIGAALPVTERISEAGARTLVLDFAVTLGDGDYVLELLAKTGDRSELSLVPFRVSR